MKVIQLYKQPKKGLRTFLSSGTLVLLGIWLLISDKTDTQSITIGWLAVVFFGLAFLLGIFSMLDRRPQIILSEEGIWDRSSRQPRISWEQIVGAYPSGIFDQKFVALKLDGTFLMSRRPYRWSKNLNNITRVQEVNLMLSDLKVRQETMVSFIEEIIAIRKNQRAEIIERYFGIQS